jgi:DNA uptake protein ComE-like DNA-binding protein
MRALILTSLGCLALTGCSSQQNPDELRQKTARATAEVKQDAKAVAEGVRDGLRRDNPIDLNHATREELLGLPGITSTQADRIMAHRPYHSRDVLVSDHILTASEYDRIKDRVVVGKPSLSH